MVPILTIAIVILNMILGVLIPLGLVMLLKKKFHLSLKVFFIGCLTMFLFAFVLEQMAHSVLLGSGAGTFIKNHFVLYSLYGGLMAALFEETGRFLAMKFLLRKEHEDPRNAIMYGAGHGGIEVFMILSLGMINNLIYSVMINAGQTQTLLEPLDEAGKAALQSGFDALISTPSWVFLMSPVERIAALIAQIALSVIVWHAVCGRRVNGEYFVLALLMHFILDVLAGILNGAGVSVAAIEIVVWILAVIYAFVAAWVWRSCRHRMMHDWHTEKPERHNANQ